MLDDAVRASAVPDGLQAVDAEALVALAGFASGRRIEDLRGALALSQPGGAHLVSRLERAGLARRARDPDDGRGVLVHLTPAGRRAAERIVDARGAAIRELVGPLSDAEQRTLLRVLDRVLHEQTTGRLHARRICRMCDPDACGHPDRCPVTRRADEIEGATGIQR
ncbi:MAG: winged helix DNA-binding protein [Solirubrobacterales bacterium]|nr:winged helix DNA-binding protein [Solirubrobacterales bacterium]